MAHYVSSLYASSVKRLPQISDITSAINRQLPLTASRRPTTKNAFKEPEEFESLEVPMVFHDPIAVINNDANGLRVSVSRSPEEMTMLTGKNAPLYIFEATKVSLYNSMGNHDCLKQLAFPSVAELEIVNLINGNGLIQTIGECCRASKLRKLTVSGHFSVDQKISFCDIFKLFPYLEELEMPLNLFFDKVESTWMKHLVNAAPMNRLVRVSLISDEKKAMEFETADLMELMTKANVGFRFQLLLNSPKVGAAYEALRTNMLSMESGRYTVDLEEGEQYIVASFQKVDDIQNPADWLEPMVLDCNSVRKVFITSSFEFMLMFRRDDLYSLFKNVNPGTILELQLHIQGNQATAISRIKSRINSMGDIPFSIQVELHDFLTVRYRLNKALSQY